jgi:plastocyanin
MRARGLAIGLAVIALAVAGCSKSSSTPPAPAPTDSAPAPTSTGSAGAATITLGGQTANNHGEADVTNQKKITVTMNDYYFSPTVIKGTASQKITIELKNEGTTTHNFSVQAFNETIDQDVKPGQTKDVQVQFGNVLDSIAVFQCKFHASQGMRGALEVPR